ncbi:alpha/beta fold hydrolase [Streptomyces sp. NPDC002952]|uniref:alpha/beta fold hydrolase n=1 Tax=Streptomyces sp. NPDC002952 TaxID=3364673 RepID=UPI0036A96D0E
MKAERTKRNVLVIAVAAAVLGPTVPFTATAATPMTSRPLVWEKCEGSGLDPRQECSTVEVPMDYSDPGGEKVALAVSRIRSEKPSARRGALLLIAGGPGGGSLDEVSTKGRTLPREVRDTYDLIGFDPRGVGRSDPVDCGLESGDLDRSTFFPWPAPDGSVDTNMATARRTADACARDGGELARHISTADNAGDIDRIRAALGERRLSAWGVSYGAYTGVVYSQLFPRRTDRVVLDSNPDATAATAHPELGGVPRATWTGFETGVEDVFPVFAEWASAPGNPDRLADRAGQVRPLLLRLAARLDREPIPWPGARPAELNGNVLRQAVVDAFYDPGEGFPGLARLILHARAGIVPPAPEPAPEPLVRNALSVALATMCNDARWPSSAARYQEDVDASRAAYPLTAGMPRNAIACAAWPWPQREEPVRITDRVPSTVLLVQNERDPATPLAGARRLRAALGARAVMVTTDSTGHDAYLGNGNACGDRIVSRYLATGQRPAADVRCR